MVMMDELLRHSSYHRSVNHYAMKFNKASYYPSERTPILKECEGEFEACFIILQPFFRLKHDEYNTQYDIDYYSKYPKIENYEMPKDYDDELNKYRYSYNENYPTKSEILKTAEKVNWTKIVNNSEIINKINYVQQALITAIGAYRKTFQKPEFATELHIQSWKNDFWFPQENKISPLIAKDIYKILHLLEIDEINLCYGSSTKSISTVNKSEYEFANLIDSRFLNTENREIVIGTGRENFNSVLYTKKSETMDKILNEVNLEGIRCNSGTQLPWDIAENELNELLKLEKQPKSAMDNT